MTPSIKILMLEDTPSDAELIQDTLKDNGLNFVAMRVEKQEAFVDALIHFKPDVILADYRLPTFNGEEALLLAKKMTPFIPVIMVSGALGDELAVKLLKLGARDYVLKDNLIRLPAAVTRAIEEANVQQQKEEAIKLLKQREKFLREAQRLGHIGDWQIDLLNDKLTWSEELFKIYERPLSLGCPTLHEVRAYHDEDSKERIIEKRQAVIDTKTTQRFELSATLQSSRKIYVYVIAEPIFNETGEVIAIQGIVQDITTHKLQEFKILRLNRIYAILSNINSLIVHSTTPHELLQNACQTIATLGNFGVVWIDLLDKDEAGGFKTFKAGPDAEYMVPRLCKLDPEQPHNQCLCTYVLTENKSILRHTSNEHDTIDCITLEDTHTKKTSTKNVHKIKLDILPNDCSIHPLGYHSRLVLPLFSEQHPIGSLSILSKERWLFDCEEKNLLDTLAGDLSFALTYLAQIDKIHQLAFYHPVTHLPNRMRFIELFDALYQSKSEGMDGAIVLISIERLANINNTLGHRVGDELLKAVGLRLQEMVGEHGLVGHIEGKQFIFAYAPPARTRPSYEIIAEMIRACFNNALRVKNRNIHISVQSGIALFPLHGKKGGQLLHRAETALNLAQMHKQRLLCYNVEMDEHVAAALKLESELREAVEKNQFVVHYQPKYHLASRTLTGFEALIRWRNEAGELVLPNEFIPLLEETGLILSIGEWIFNQVLIDLLKWQKMGLNPPRIAVNVSSLQLEQGDFVSSLEKILKKHPAAAPYLDVEITESMLLARYDETVHKLNQLRKLGCQIYLDDFGTGYSSLSYLVSLPLDAIKIDRSFIIMLPQNADTLSIVYNVISIAHQLNFKVVAEGVDSHEQENLLRLLKCDEVQGFLYHKALSVSEVETLLGATESKPASQQKQIPQAT